MNIKTRDLMIGDKLIYKPTGEYCIVASIFIVKDRIVVSSISTHGNLQYSTPLPASDFQPVPIDEDLLEKIGFARIAATTKPRLAVYKHDVMEFNIKHNDVRLKINNVFGTLDVECKYLHTLQHAMRLFGIG